MFGSACGLSSGFEGIWRMGRFWPRSPRFATATCCPTQPRKSSHRPRNRWPPGRSANDVCKRCNYLPGHLQQPLQLKKKQSLRKKKTAETSIDPKIAWKTGKHHGFSPFLRFTGRFTFSFRRFTPFRPFFESLVLSGWVSLTARSAASRSAELSGLACEEVPSFLDVKLHEIQKKTKKQP